MTYNYTLKEDGRVLLSRDLRIASVAASVAVALWAT
jgi:hypothetical protein